MDDEIPERAWSGRVRPWFEPTPAELVGLVVLLLGSLAFAGVVWVRSGGVGPVGVGVGAATVGSAVVADGGVGHAVAGAEAAPGSSPTASDVTAPHVDAPPTMPMTVHVTGAVRRAGLVTVPTGARVGDAVSAAGGLTAEAMEELINLARPVVDGEHVHVPREGEPPQLAGAPPSGTAADAGPGSAGTRGDGRIDINHADVAELQRLPGIGPARAEAIVSHREQHGPFATPGDLRAVSGIGEVTFQRLADLIHAG